MVGLPSQPFIMNYGFKLVPQRSTLALSALQSCLGWSKKLCNTFMVGVLGPSGPPFSTQQDIHHEQKIPSGASQELELTM